MNPDTILLIGIVFAIVAMTIFMIVYFRSPYKFPYQKIDFDVTSKKQPDMLDYIDKYLLENGEKVISEAVENLKEWKETCEQKISKSHFKKHRRKQYEKCLDEDNLFVFSFYRVRTRYRQVNYVKYPYQVKQLDSTYTTNYSFMDDRYKQLENINFESTLKDYNSNKQRKLMTKELRDEITLRDNFTCQKCGKYMPDGVGLHIDHIVPISRGGKSVASNLQVLCSKCNGSKSNKSE